MTWQTLARDTPPHVPAAPHAARTPGPPTAAWLGDSLTEGAEVAEAERFATLTSAAFGWIPANRGRGGTGYLAPGPTGSPEHAPFTERVAEIVADAPEVVIVSGGNNDAVLGTSDDELRAAVTATIAPLREALPDAAIYVVGPFWPDNVPPEAVLGVRQVVAQVAAEVGVPFIDPLEDEWITGGIELGNDADVIGPDGIHPSAAGHAYIAERLVAELTAVGARPAS